MNHYILNYLLMGLVGAAGIIGVDASVLLAEQFDPELEPLIIQVIVGIVTILGIIFRARKDRK